MHSPRKPELNEQLDRSVAAAPGAVPPTGGAVPEDGAAAAHAPREHDVDELVDALGLLLRAARDLDPERRDPAIPALESASEQVITSLQELETRSQNGPRQRAAVVADATRRELTSVIQHTLTMLRASLLENSRS